MEKLLEGEDAHRGLFAVGKDGRQVGRGRIPTHYKRCTIPEGRRDYLAWLGLSKLVASYLDTSLFYTQALIAGVALSGDYDQITIVTCSQYGKTWLMGRLALRMAFDGHPMNIGGSMEALTEKIMRQCMVAVSSAADDIKKALTAEQLKKVDRLDQSVSKTRLSFPGKGQVQGVSLGDAYEDIGRNKAVGETGAWIVDEAALVSERSMAELGRREFSSIDGTVEPLIMISNPHKAGYFYDCLTEDPMDARSCVIWADALTMAQEGRRSADKILASKFAQSRDTIQRYLLCELPTDGAGMFDTPKVASLNVDGTAVLGIDAAYKGKDSIEVCHAKITGDGLYIEDVATIKKTVWIDGVTSREIIDQVAKTYHALGCALCCVDIGFGVWLLEGLKYRGVNAHGVNFGAGPSKWRIREKHYVSTIAQNRRAEMHLDLQDLIENRALTLSPQVHERIKSVLPMVVCETKPNGKKQVIPKAEIKAKLGHSPDAFDAVLLAVHAAVLYGADAVSYITEEAS